MHPDRLEHLAKFLYTLDPERFDYTTFGNLNECGASACALGWCHVAFKEECITKFNEIPRFLVNGISLDYTKFFDINDNERMFLFFPHDAGISPDTATSMARVDGFKRMNPHSTAKEVAAHIRKFIEHGGIYDY